MKGSSIGLREAVSIGVGTMIGASIFTIFGVGARLAGPDLPIALLLSSILALMVGYSYSKLGSRIVSNAGPIQFIVRGIGDNVVTGAMSLLMWLSYVVSIALFLEGFVGYLLPLLHVPPTPEARGVAQVLVISSFVGLNFLGAKTVGRAEILIVVVKLLILGLLVVAGTSQIQWERIAPRFGGSQVSGIVTASAVFFLSYMGFGLITNASEDMRNAPRNVPRAIYLSILIVAVVYVAVSGVVIGSLPLQDVLQAKENALAAAARPALGQAGYLIVSIGALFSIASALNATLYGGANIAYTLAKEGELPEIFERKVWFRSTEGLYMTALLGLLMALLLDTGSIASVTSAVFISIYLLVLTSHLRLVGEVGGKPLLIKINRVVISAAFLVLLYHMFQTSRGVLYGTVALFALALLLDYIYRRVTGRRFVPVR